MKVLKRTQHCGRCLLYSNISVSSFTNQWVCVRRASGEHVGFAASVIPRNVQCNVVDAEPIEETPMECIEIPPEDAEEQLKSVYGRGGVEQYTRYMYMYY